MKKSSLIILCAILTLGLTGCGQDQTKKINELNLEIDDLKAKVIELYQELDALKNQDYTYKYNNGSFDCHNQYGIQKVKFLSSRIIYIYGLDETKTLMYNNYYLLNLTGMNKYEIVDEIVLPDSLPKRTIQFLRSEWAMGYKYMKEINILDNGATLTISNEPTEVCTFVKSN